MKRSKVKFALIAATAFLILSITLGIASIYYTSTGNISSKNLIDNTFHLSPNEERRQGIGNFHGNSTIVNESITVKVTSSDLFVKNFSVITYSFNIYNTSTTQNITYTFPSGADYYEAVFTVDNANSGTIHFQAFVAQSELQYQLSWLTAPAKILFLISLSIFMLIGLKEIFFEPKNPEHLKRTLQGISKREHRLVLSLLAISLVFWLAVSILNTNPLGTYDNWYTDHSRHSYTASLFLKDGLAIFTQPLDVLASGDHSAFMFVTWPEMPHLYPIGSVILFLPFGALIQSGVNALLVYKLEMTLFIIVAHVCLYYFLCRFLAQRPFPQLDIKNPNETLKLLREGNQRQRRILTREYVDLALIISGAYIMYMSLVTFAADGMFDAIPFLFALLGVIMFLSERYDKFLLLIGISVLFKYQTGIFLFPLIIFGIIKILENKRIIEVVKNKGVVLAVAFAGISGFTAYLSAPYLMQTRPELIMNGVNAFAPHAQIEWPLQTTAVLLTLIVTLIYAGYMYNKNKLLSLSAAFLLLPTFTLPYFQNWYLPYLFVYVLIPQRKNGLTATIIWLIYMSIVLSYGGTGFNPQLIISHFESTLKSSMQGLGL